MERKLEGIENEEGKKQGANNLFSFVWI